MTIADRAAEELLRERIAERFPDDGIIGEEFGASGGTSGYQWVLDPIDGTKSFIHGVPLYTTLVAVLRRETSREIGVISRTGRTRRNWCTRRRAADVGTSDADVDRRSASRSAFRKSQR